MVRTLIFVLCLFAAACTQPVKHWEHPSATEDQWQVDRADCRSRARRDAERDYVGASRIARPTDDDITQTYTSQMRLFGAKRSEQSLYENCLKRRGYVPAKARKSGQPT